MTRRLPILAGALTAAALAVGLAAADPPNGGHGRPPPPSAGQQDSLGAGWREQQDEARQGVKQRRLVPLGRVVEALARRFPGRQLDAGLEYDGERPIYRVRWITQDGRRIDFMIDAATGQVLSGG